MVNTRSKKEQKTEDKLKEKPNVTIKEIDLETPDQSIDGKQRKTTESITMHNKEEPVTKALYFSQIGSGDKTTNKALKTMKDDSQTKRTSVTEKLAAMAGMRPKEKEEVTTVTEKSRAFGPVSTITMESNPEREQVTERAAGNRDRRSIVSEAPLVKLGDLMSE